MRRLTVIITVMYSLLLAVSIARASTVTLPGSWRVDMQYCRNGYTASSIVAGGVAASNATNNIVINDAVGESICGAHALWFVSPSPLYGEGAGG